MNPRYKLRMAHFDNDRRFQVYSGENGRYSVLDTETNETVIEAFGCDYCCMKANDLNAKAAVISIEQMD